MEWLRGVVGRGSVGEVKRHDFLIISIKSRKRGFFFRWLLTPVLLWVIVLNFCA